MYKITLPALIVFALFFFSCVRARPVYIEDEKRTVEAAVKLFIKRFNNNEFELIYNTANDSFKNAIGKEAFLSSVKETREQNGNILEVTENLIKVFPSSPIQVRAIYNFKCEKGERSIWFIYFMGIDGKASLAQIETYGGYSDLSKYKTEEIK